jgi:hypothetical protein
MRVELKVPAPAIAAVRAAMPGAMPEKAPPPPPGHGYVTAWIVSGVLVASTIALGTSTLVEQHNLETVRASYPVQKGTLDHYQALTTGLAITSDILGAASLAAVGVATYLTVKHERGKHLHVGVTARGLSVGGTF